jgi:hypothetical protein
MVKNWSFVCYNKVVLLGLQEMFTDKALPVLWYSCNICVEIVTCRDLFAFTPEFYRIK